MTRARTWLLLLLVPPLALGLQAFQAARVATPEELSCAAQHIRAGFQPGDVVRFEPAWAYEAWPLVKELPVDRTRTLEVRPLQRYQRLWVLATLGHRAPGSYPVGFEPITTFECGDATVRLVRLPYRGEPVYDFVAALKQADVARVYDGHGPVPRSTGKPGRRGSPRVERCRRWIDGGWHCGRKHPWQYVGPTTKDVGDSPRHGLWAHPLDGGHKLEITWARAPLGRELQVEGGLTLRAVNAAAGAPVHFAVRIDDETVLRADVGVSDRGWKEWTVDTSRWTGRRARVVFVVWTEDHQARQWMFAARAY